jgi:anti-sigma-K factor RskA
MAEYEELVDLVRRAAPPFEVPAGLEQRVFAAIAPPRRRRLSWRLLAPLAAATAAAAVLVVLALTGRGAGLERYALRGGDALVNATVETTGVGREVTVDIERLRDPRPDGLYELWFVAPDGRRRVSAGTFHPDDAGRGRVRLVAAADPKRYPRISVTLEPADGNPRRQGPTVLRAVPAS